MILNDKKITYPYLLSANFSTWEKQWCSTLLSLITNTYGPQNFLHRKNIDAQPCWISLLIRFFLHWQNVADMLPVFPCKIDALVGLSICWYVARVLSVICACHPCVKHEAHVHLLRLLYWKWPSLLPLGFLLGASHVLIRCWYPVRLASGTLETTNCSKYCYL